MCPQSLEMGELVHTTGRANAALTDDRGRAIWPPPAAVELQESPGGGLKT